MTHPLMIPRFLVIGDYPNSPFAVGDIITLEWSWSQNYYYHNSNVTGYMPEHNFHAFENVFRRMSWHEKRELSDMPEYLTDTFVGVIVIKVSEYRNHAGEWWFVSEGNALAGYVQPLTIYKPSNELDYQSYLKTIK